MYFFKTSISQMKILVNLNNQIKLYFVIKFLQNYFLCKRLSSRFCILCVGLLSSIVDMKRLCNLNMFHLYYYYICFDYLNETALPHYLESLEKMGKVTAWKLTKKSGNLKIFLIILGKWGNFKRVKFIFLFEWQLWLNVLSSEFNSILI